MPVYVVSTAAEMPDGDFVISENEDGHAASDPHAALDIDLDMYVYLIKIILFEYNIFIIF